MLQTLYALVNLTSNEKKALASQPRGASPKYSTHDAKESCNITYLNLAKDHS